MRIALVANSAWYIYNFRMSLITRLLAEGMQVVVITPVDDYINALTETEGIEVVPVKQLDRKRTNLLQELRLLREFQSIYQTVKPDVVLHYTIKANVYGGWVAKRLGINTISILPGLGYAFTRKSKLRSFIKRLYRWVLPHSSYVIFENHSDHDKFVDQQIITRQQGVVFKGCGVDTDYFSPMPKTRRDEKVVFLFMGRLIKEKGIHEFVRAAERVHRENEDTEFWIIGHIDAENPSAVPYDTFLKWIKPRYIKYLGFQDDVRQVIRNADCVVLPSYYPEGIPRVLQEGMAMEKPIITADSNGCREAITPNSTNGLLVAPESVPDLANAMSLISELDPEARQTMGRNGRAWALSQFREEITLDLYIKYIKLTLGQDLSVKHVKPSSPSTSVP